MKKIIIFKNDRTGDLFVSLPTINKIINKYRNYEIEIFLSDINEKFSFLFPRFVKKIIPFNLNIISKFKIFFYLLSNKVDKIFILTPKNFYYFLPLFFRKIKFYAIVIDSENNRPNNYLRKYLHKYVIIDRINIKKRQSSYDLQKKLIDFSNKEIDFLNRNNQLTIDFSYPSNFIFFHYKKNFFEKNLLWDLNKVVKLIEYLSTRFENLLFTSEYKDNEVNNFFSSYFNTYDCRLKKINSINTKNIFFLKDVDGYDLFETINKSSKIISPEGIMTHIGYFLKKPILSLMHFNFNNKQDFKKQIISCKEWFPPNNYSYTVLKKDYQKSIRKLNKRI